MRESWREQVDARLKQLTAWWNALEDSDRRYWRWFGSLAATITVLWLLSYIVISVFFSGPGNAGEVGDSFGAVNALFSGLAFAGLIVTLLLQLEDGRSQRDETKKTLEALTRAAGAQERTLQVLAEQVRLARVPFEPLLVVSRADDRGMAIDLVLTNHGTAIRNLEIRIKGNDNWRTSFDPSSDQLLSGGSVKITFSTWEDPRPREIEGAVVFTTTAGYRAYVSFYLKLPPPIIALPALPVEASLGPVVGYFDL